MEVNGFKGNEIICDAMRQVLDFCNFLKKILIFFYFCQWYEEIPFLSYNFFGRNFVPKVDDTREHEKDTLSLCF